ncbi:MAG: DUF547 domain-containing protein, partial [Cyclobacteriaceae bacterium]|nr:DUF547 domain-containing protein [Cyclobacteriaceae bacterium HetDA_MAG_MS6]
DDLNTLYESISSFDWERSTDEVKKAFLVNAYNIIVIKQVVDQLPLKSPLDNPKFFNGIAHQVAGKKMTLDDLEKGTLLKKFPDSRVHFIVVCAAKSCPPLANFAFFPDRLEKQIQDRTIEVLNLDWFVRVNNNKAEFSQIFNWYRGDFEKNGKSLIDYVNDFREEKIMAKKVGFYEYDWSLNKKG